MSSQDPLPPTHQNPAQPPPPTLPNEIILHIVECLIPAGHKAIAIHAFDPITETLLSLARTSSLTHPTALRLLYTHCLYIHNRRRLVALTTALSLSIKHEEAQQSREKHHQREISRRSRYLLRPNSTPPPEPILVSVHKYVTSLYLSPLYDMDDGGQMIQDVCKLLELIAPTLTRLMLSIDTFFWDGDNSDPYLRMLLLTLVKLKSLEVFANITDSLELMEDHGFNTREIIAWAHWPKLRLLALSGANPSRRETWRLFGSMEALERIIFIRPDGMGLFDHNQLYMDGQHGRATVKKLEIVIVEQNEIEYATKWEELPWENEGALQFRTVSCGHKTCTYYVRKRLLRGEETMDASLAPWLRT